MTAWGYAVAREMREGTIDPELVHVDDVPRVTADERRAALAVAADLRRRAAVDAAYLREGMDYERGSK